MAVVFHAEEGIRDRNVTGVQTCALPIYFRGLIQRAPTITQTANTAGITASHMPAAASAAVAAQLIDANASAKEIGRASCRGSVEEPEPAGHDKEGLRGAKRQ